MTRRCVALFSGGLDSMLAVRAMQVQGIEVEVVNFKTIFTCCQDQAAQAARELNVRLTILAPDDDYLDLVKFPRFGYGKGANPCVDCRIYMLHRARRYQEQSGADFVISGEVVGQRPMSQKRKDLDVIAFHTHLEDLLLRPLSAKLLPETLPEREGWVDRSKLHAIRGRGRRELIALAEQYGLKHIPTPSNGCALTEQLFAQKVHDLIDFDADAQRWDFELLKIGRHFRYDAQTKVVVGRNDPDNQQLAWMAEQRNGRAAAVLSPHNFMGPRAVVVGAWNEGARTFAVGLVMRYTKLSPEIAEPRIRCQTPTGEEMIVGAPDAAASRAKSLAV